MTKLQILEDELIDAEFKLQCGYDRNNGVGISRVKWEQDWRLEIARIKKEIEKEKLKTQ